MTDPTVDSGRPSRAVRYFLAHPAVGLVSFLGGVASLVALPVGIIAWLDARLPNLVYAVNPVSTIVAKQGTTARLGVTFDGKPVSRDVVAVQLGLWNDGQEAIRRDSVLKPLVLKLDPPARVLEASVLRASRDVVGLAVDQVSSEDGEVRLGWDILEHDDGGVIQIIHLGDRYTKIRAQGVIVGQNGIFPWGRDAPARPSRIPTVAVILLYVQPVSAAYALWFAFELRRRFAGRRHRQWSAGIRIAFWFLVVSNFVYFACLFSLIALRLATPMPTRPPFGWG